MTSDFLGSILVGKTRAEVDILKKRIEQLTEAGLKAKYLCSSDLFNKERLFLSSLYMPFYLMIINWMLIVLLHIHRRLFLSSLLLYVCIYLIFKWFSLFVHSSILIIIGYHSLHGTYLITKLRLICRLTSTLHPKDAMQSSTMSLLNA